MARTPKPIDWDEVDLLIEAGCQQQEIAAIFRIHRDNFHDRIVEKHGKCFTEYASHIRCAGLANIRKVQYDKALEGSVQMLTLLGEEWLGQGKKVDDIPSKDEQVHSENAEMPEKHKLRTELEAKDKIIAELQAKVDNLSQTRQELYGSDAQI